MGWLLEHFGVALSGYIILNVAIIAAVVRLHGGVKFRALLEVVTGSPRARDSSDD